MLREIVGEIRRTGNPIEIAVRLSAFDTVPFHADPASPGAGRPVPHGHCLPYRFGFGMNPGAPTEPDLAEPQQFLELCAALGIRLVNLSAGSPYYTPHLLRPAAYPPSDGYPPPEDPLVGVARQMGAVRELRSRAPRGLTLIGSGYTYLQEYLPHVAQAAVRGGWTDLVGMGRMVLSYPGILADATRNGTIGARSICRTFSDCTTAPRNGMISGCYPLDRHYASLPEATRLKQLKGRSKP
jgi:2,4-dienoyl-CoA reductase-like NADH-dependent reductase (Old Yellow Enzyme family)